MYLLPSIQPPHLRLFFRSNRHALAGGLILIFALVAGTAATVWREFSDAEQRDRQQLAFMASAIEGHATQVFEACGMVLDNLVASLLKAPDDLASLEELQTNYLRGLPFLQGLSAVDPDGQVLTSTHLADRGASLDLRRLAPRPAQGDRMVIGPWTAGRTLVEGARQVATPARAGFIPLVRRVQLSQSRSVLLVAQVNPDALTGYQQPLFDTSPPGARVLLALDDGSLLSQSGGESHYRGHSLRAHPLFRDGLPVAHMGSYGPAQTLGSLSLGAWQRSGNQPLVSLVERPYASTSQRVLDALREPLMLVLPALALVAFAARSAWRNARRQETSLARSHQMRREAQQCQQELATLLEHGHALVLRTDRNGVICHANERWHALFSARATSAVGKCLWELALPDCRHAAEALFKPEPAETVRNAQIRLAGADGQTRVLEVAVTPLHDHGGRLQGFACSAMDVTVLQASRQQLQDQQAFTSLLLETIPLPVCTTDLEGRFLTVNQAWERFMGLQREHVLGLRGSEFMPPEAAQAYEAHDEDFGTRICYEARLCRHDGSARTVEITKVRRLSHQGQPLGLLIAMKDVTDLPARKEPAERGTHAGNRDFVTRISHELNRPLQSILGFSELGMGRASAPDTLRAMFGDIHAAGQSILEFLNELLDIPKTEGSIDSFHFERHDVRTLIGETVAGLAPQLAHKRLTLELQLGAAALVAKVDSRRFTQVMHYVLTSAAQFSPEGQAIHVAASSLDQTSIHISVCDQGPGRSQGPGIAQEEIQAVLQTFTQLGQTGEDAPGVDLGLAVCHKIITAHGGRIYTTNAPEGGVVFHITLPHAGHRIPEPAVPQWTESP